ncbi:hypothetical protein LCGC14_0459010 [marine sediment metagenome]|uniref:Uncharacterized protein n=1 Tax=marine sediment metagenome TaxID=412755 RepID=A0A0F9SY97_9ZZZZ
MPKKKTKPKKVRSLFFRNKDIVSEKKKLKVLKSRRRQIIDNIKEVVDAYNNESLDIHRTCTWLEQLPLESLRDLYHLLTDDYGLSTLELRARLLSEHNKGVVETVSVDKEIYLSQIDLLLAEIGCIQSKLDPG